jgi:predicted transglutaminase-like protease
VLLSQSQSAISPEVIGTLRSNFWKTKSLKCVVFFSIPSYRIIRRRVIWLIGRWINVKLSPPYRPTLYEIIINLMNESEDFVVSIVNNTMDNKING